MMSERDERLLRDYLADALDPTRQAAVEAHLVTCHECRDLLDHLRVEQHVDSLIGGNALVEPPSDLHERIFDSDEFAAIQRDSAKHAAVTPPPTEQAKRLLVSSPLTTPYVLLPASGVLLLLLVLVVLTQHGIR